MAAKKTYTYKLITICSTLSGIETELNSLGVQGWEVYPISMVQSLDIVTFTGLARKA